jgi:Metallo-beta-lactamase superfamily
MAEIGYAPEDIKYLALSHLHADHTANANDFAGSTWLVHQNERDAMFGGPRVPGSFQPANFAKLKDSKTIILTEKDYDVFGDGTVVIKYAPGHSPGHQILFLRLKESGPEAKGVGTGPDRGRPVPLAPGDFDAQGAGGRIQQRAGGRFPRDGARFSATDRCAALDRARSSHLRYS